MKKFLLLTTASIFCANQLAAQEFGLVRTEPESTGAGIGTIAVGALIAGAAVIAIAGGGGGGGGGGGSDKGNDGGGTTDPLPEAGSGPYRGPTAPREGFNTQEYRRNWGIDAINADARYADGGTGLGFVSGVFDTGADVDHVDLDDQIIYRYNYYTLDNNVSDDVGHGTHVAGIIAAEKNNLGTHGVAYDSKLAIFKALGGEGDLAIDFMDAWADANMKAGEIGVNAMNHSWNFLDVFDNTATVSMFSSASQVRNYFGDALLDSLDYAVSKDIISVFAAGNSGLSDAGNQAALAMYFPEYSDHILTVVALDKFDQIADYSNRCGLAESFCIAAPGSSILSTLPGDMIGTMSGTSMAVPHVVGAIGLLESNFPELTGAEVTRILKDTARDLGAVGVDEIYGVGALDLENAMAPQGVISLQASGTLGDRSYSAASSHISSGGGIARALEAAFSSQDIIVTDRYDRGYATSMDVFVGNGEDISHDQKKVSAFVKGKSRETRLSTAGASMAFSIDGIGALATEGSIDPSVSSPYAGLIENPSAMRYDANLGAARVSLSAAAGSLLDQQDADHYLALEARAPIGPAGVTLGIGHLYEQSAFLGTDVSGAFGDALDTRTSFVSLRGDLTLSADSAVFLTGSLGQSLIDGGGLIREGAITSRNIGLGFDSRNAFTRGDRLQVSVSRPMAVSDGHMTVSVPTGLAASVDGVRSDKVSMSTAKLDMDETSAPVDLKIGYEVKLRHGRLAMGGALRQGDYRHRVASIGYNISF